MHVLICLIGAVLIVTPGCGRNKKEIEECNQLIGIVNNAVDSINAPKGSNSDELTADYKRIVSAMEVADAEAAKVSFTVPALHQLSMEYQLMSRDIAKASRDMVAAADAQDFAKVFAAKKTRKRGQTRRHPRPKN